MADNGDMRLLEEFIAGRVVEHWKSLGHATTQGWDRAVESASLRIMGGGEHDRGRRRVAALALAELCATDPEG